MNKGSQEAVTIADGIIQLLEKRGQLELLGEIITLLSDFKDKKDTRNVAIVKTAVSLNENERDMLKKQLSEIFGRPIAIEEHIDEQIIGGMFIQVGDTVLDYTISSRIDVVKHTA